MPAVALLLLPPLLLLAMTVWLASAARPAATLSTQPAAPAQVASGVEPGEVSVAAGMLLVVTKASPSETPGTWASVVSPALTARSVERRISPALRGIPTSGPSKGHNRSYPGEPPAAQLA